MYIIDPLYVYLIEQLSKINILMFIIGLASAIGIIANIVILSNNKNDKEKFLESIKWYLGRLNGYVENNTKQINRITTIIDPNNVYDKISKKDKGNPGEFTSVEMKINTPIVEINKETKILLENSAEIVEQRSKSIEELCSQVDLCIKDYEKCNSYKFPSLKLCIVLLAIVSLIITVIPTKESAYKILFSSMLTVENVSKDGELTTDVANNVIEKITESIIKIQNSK